MNTVWRPLKMCKTGPTTIHHTTWLAWGRGACASCNAALEACSPGWFHLFRLSFDIWIPLTFEHSWYLTCIASNIQPASEIFRDPYPTGGYSYDTFVDPEKTKCLDSLRTHYSASALAALVCYWQWGFLPFFWLCKFRPASSNQRKKGTSQNAQSVHNQPQFKKREPDRSQYG